MVVATNQSGIGRGLFEMATLNAIHDKMHRAVGQAGGRIDAVFYCPHAQEANCGCRKPKPGLLEEIGRRFNTEPEGRAVHRRLRCATCRRRRRSARSRSWC